MTKATKAIPTTPRILIDRKNPSAFKVCPLCAALNVVENDHCCQCSWFGQFETDQHLVQIKMYEMVDASPELQVLLLKELRRPWWRAPLSWMRSLLRRRIDIRA